MRERVYIDPESYDVNPSVVLEIEPESELHNGRRRVVRTATLDGESVMDDGGYSESDRTLTLVLLTPSESTLEELSRLAEDYDYWTLGTHVGMFKVKLYNMRSSGGRTTVVLYVHSRLDT